MDINKHTNRQNKTTDISPYLRKAQVRAFLENITNLIGDISNFSDDKLMNLLLYGENIHSVEVNASILYSLFSNHPKGLMFHYYKISYVFDTNRLPVYLFIYLLYYIIFNLCAVPH